MPDSEFCYGFLIGFLTAGALGFILQRLLMLSKKAGAADKKVAVVETKQSPKEVYMSSARAKMERALWFFLLIVVAVAAAILLIRLS